MSTTKADDKQVGGSHYKAMNPAQEHWNLVVAYQWDYFTAQAIKYLMRWRAKNGVQDLEKARHFLDKLIEIEKSSVPVKSIDDGSEPGPGYVNQG